VADPAKPSGYVEHIGGGLLKGYIDVFTPLGNASIGSEIWYDICQNAKTLVNKTHLDITAPPEPIAAAATHSWVARRPTTLKRSIHGAATLPAEHKIPVAKNDLITASTCTPDSGHFRLDDVCLNSEQLDGTWFAWTDHWQQYQAA
jgi:hypothetical protein